MDTSAVTMVFELTTGIMLRLACLVQAALRASDRVGGHRPGRVVAEALVGAMEALHQGKARLDRMGADADVAMPRTGLGHTHPHMARPSASSSSSGSNDRVVPLAAAHADLGLEALTMPSSAGGDPGLHSSTSVAQASTSPVLLPLREPAAAVPGVADLGAATSSIPDLAPEPARPLLRRSRALDLEVADMYVAMTQWERRRGCYHSSSHCPALAPIGGTGVMLQPEGEARARGLRPCYLCSQ